MVEAVAAALCFTVVWIKQVKANSGVRRGDLVGQFQPKYTMHEPVVFRIRIQGQMDESWSEYFSAQSVTIESDEAGNKVTVLISKPIDQAALVGIVNHLNSLGIPLIAVEPV